MRRTALFLFFGLLAGSASAEPALRVTGVALSGDAAAVVLNGALVIRDVRLPRGRRTLDLPGAGAGRAQVRIPSFAAYREILDAVRAGRAYGPASPLPFSVGEPRLHRGFRRAEVDVTFAEAVVVTAAVFRGSAGGPAYWVGFPGRRTAEGFRAQVFLLDPALKRAVEEAVLQRFERTLSETAPVRRSPRSRRP